MRKKKSGVRWVKWTPKMLTKFIEQAMTVGIPQYYGVKLVEHKRIMPKRKAGAEGKGKDVKK